jgi:hypothetical protein
VSTTIAKWFVPIARGTVDKICRFGSLLGFTRSMLWAVRVCSNPVFRLLCFVDCLSPGPRKNDLTIYWAFGPFGRSFYFFSGPGGYLSPTRGTCEREKGSVN